MIVEADANQLQQALVNLALNARDALRTQPANRPRQVPGYDTHPAANAAGSPLAQPIVFHLRPAVLASEQAGFPQQVPPGDYVVVEVEDHGSGMTADVLTQALDPFFTTKEVGQGTGLGLPMVFGIVQGHQGYLTIDSAPQRGTRVSLYLPRALPSAESASAPSHFGEVEIVEPETTPSCSILVIDDEEAVLDVVRRFLQIAGHEVVCVSSGQEALEHLGGGQHCDLIILDLMMPREDAVALFQRLRQRRPGVPVLLCTGLPHAEPAPELLRSGAAGLIRKPFRMNELWYAVKQALVTPNGNVPSP